MPKRITVETDGTLTSAEADKIREKLGDRDFEEFITLASEYERAKKKRLKADKTQHEKDKLMNNLASGVYASKKEKVAFILNNYPDTRNSDIHLATKFWEVFQRNIYGDGKLDKEKLFSLERMTSLARIRAKIQNDYGLFLADEPVRRRRKLLDEEIRETIARDVPAHQIINIYADETGKTSPNVIVGSVWLLDGYSSVIIYNRYTEFKKQKNYDKEFHFTRMGKKDVEIYKSFVDLVYELSSYVSFKAIVANMSGSSRHINDTVRNLYRHLVITGISHEIVSGRVTLPRILSLTIDHEDSLDAIALTDLRNDIQHDLTRLYNDSITIKDIGTYNSKHSALIQIADLISGALNRRYNNNGEVNFRDDFADYLLDKLSLNATSETTVDSDSAIVINL